MTLAKRLAKQIPSSILGGLILAPLWNRRNLALNEAALNSLALHSDDRVLEVGFGGGYLLGRMAAVVTEGSLAGVDVSPAMVAFCERRYRALVRKGKLELKCASAESLPYPDHHFDKVCTVNSVFYWEDAGQAISELYRVLEEGGVLVMVFTCKESLETKRLGQGIVLYEDDQVYQMIESAGFGKIEMCRASDRYREFVCAAGTKPRRSQ
jgi:SAM-dependent methyltransferase